MICNLDNREERLMDYAAGSLSAADAALFEKHLEACSACREFAAGQRNVWQALDLFEPAPVSAAFDRQLYQRMAQTSWWDRLRASLSAPFHAPAFLRHGLPLAAAATLLAAAAIVWERPAPAPAPAPRPPAQITAEAGSTLQPEQVQRALDDMEMLREFNHLVVADTPQSKM